MTQTSHTTLNQNVSPSPEVVDGRIRELERKYDLLQFKIDGWCVWPIFRFDAALMILNLPWVSRTGLSRKDLYRLVLRDLLNLVEIRKARYVVKTFSSARSEMKNGLSRDIYFDDLLGEVGDYFKIESVNSGAFIASGRKALVKADLTATAVGIIAGRLARIGGPASILKVASSLSECFKQEPGLEDFTFQRVKSRLFFFYWTKRLWAWILRRIRPEYLFVAEFGEYEFVVAAKELGIKVIEFQHGIINRHCFGYSWDAYARPHKPSLPIPDLLFLYGAYGREELMTNGFWDRELCPVGSLRIDQYRRTQSVDGKKGKTCTILVTTQGIDVERVTQFFLDFINGAHGTLDVSLFIKLHPGYETDKKPYLKVFGSARNVQVLLGHEAPSTFELLCRSHLHVSIFSHCHYEALALGIPTVILPFSTHENVLHLYEAGHAFLARTPKDLLDIALQWRKHTVPVEVGQRYFTPGALENIKRELG